MDITPEMEDGIVSALADKCDAHKARTGRSPLDDATPEQRREIDAARIRHEERTRRGRLR